MSYHRRAEIIMKLYFTQFPLGHCQHKVLQCWRPWSSYQSPRGMTPHFGGCSHYCSHIVHQKWCPQSERSKNYQDDHRLDLWRLSGQSLETIIEIYTYSHSIVALEVYVTYRCMTGVWRDQVTSKIITYLDKDRIELQLLSSDLKSFSIFITLVCI